MALRVYKKPFWASPNRTDSVYFEPNVDTLYRTVETLDHSCGRPLKVGAVMSSQLRSIAIDVSWLLEGLCFACRPGKYMTERGGGWLRNTLWFPTLEEIILVYNHDLRLADDSLTSIPLEKPEHEHGTALSTIRCASEQFLKDEAGLAAARCKGLRQNPPIPCSPGSNCPPRHVLEGMLPKFRAMVIPFRAKCKPPVPVTRKWEENIANPVLSCFCEKGEELKARSRRQRDIVGLA